MSNAICGYFPQSNIQYQLGTARRVQLGRVCPGRRQSTSARAGREGVQAAALPNRLLTPAKEKNVDNDSSSKFPMMQYFNYFPYCNCSRNCQMHRGKSDQILFQINEEDESKASSRNSIHRQHGPREADEEARLPTPTMSGTTVVQASARSIIN